MLGVADEVCAGRLVMCHEGGYSPAYVPYCGLAIMEELAGMRTELADPLLDLLASFGGQELQPHQEAVIQGAMKRPAPVRAPPPRHTQIKERHGVCPVRRRIPAPHLRASLVGAGSAPPR